MKLENTTFGGIDVLAVSEWLADGIVHGFASSSLDLSSGRPPAPFMTALHASEFISPKQVHGTNIVDLRAASVDQLRSLRGLEADGVVVQAGRRGFLVGIRTADCMPIIARAGDSIALVHAGWRGLAAGIVERAVAMLSQNGEVSLAFGPCIRSARFEVGNEVISALGPSAVFDRDSDGVARVSLVESALARVPATTRSIDCNVCTFDTHRFHSYRRDKAASGRNLAFVSI